MWVISAKAVLLYPNLLRGLNTASINGGFGGKMCMNTSTCDCNTVVVSGYTRTHPIDGSTVYVVEHYRCVPENYNTNDN